MTAARHGCDAAVTQRRRRRSWYLRRVTETRSGLVHGVAAYSFWGIAPLYWKLRSGVSPAERSSRIAWCGAMAGSAT